MYHIITIIVVFCFYYFSLIMVRSISKSFKFILTITVRLPKEIFPFLQGIYAIIIIPHFVPHDHVCGCSKIYKKESAYTVVQKYKRNAFQDMRHTLLFEDITKKNEFQCTQLFKNIRKRNVFQHTQCTCLFKDITKRNKL